ncbi:MAG: CRISPR-associated protein Cas4 [Defluviitaleaceae bacterium]|nr:CRISPR-associated protein Cas4 [Defluviitaleaceae bacterium]
MDTDDYLLVSGIQHFKFCKRQWALIHIEQQWSENYFTAIGRKQHEKVDAGLREKRGNVITTRAMPVISHNLKVQGVCDVVEFVKNESGININGLDGLYSVSPVEYKRGKPKKGKEDHLQLVAQAICLEEMLCTSIDYGYMFYKTTLAREKVTITPELRQEVVSIFKNMHELFLKQYTPKPRKKPHCVNCSMYDICLPQIFDSHRSQDPKKFIEESLQ